MLLDSLEQLPEIGNDVWPVRSIRLSEVIDDLLRVTPPVPSWSAHPDFWQR